MVYSSHVFNDGKQTFHIVSSPVEFLTTSFAMKWCFQEQVTVLYLSSSCASTQQETRHIPADGFKLKLSFNFFICHVHNNFDEAVIGNEILSSQAPSNNAQTICIKRKLHK